MENGNGGYTHLKISHWNLGARQWHRKIEDIEALIQDKDPDMLFISEANLMRETTPEERHINGYVQVLPNSMEARGYARIVLLVRENIEFKILENFMPLGSAAIWVSIGRPGRKPLRVGGYYREHTLLRQDADPNRTGDPQFQKARWDQLVGSWKTAAANDYNCILIGDLNLDFLEWGHPEERHKSMVEKVKTEIEILGFTQLVNGMTRCWIDQKDSAVDHIWTNAHNRIISHSNTVRSGSDHNVVSVLVRLKDRVQQKQEILKRIKKNMDPQKLKDKMRQVDWTSLLACEDINLVNHMLESTIREAYDQEAPLRKIQCRRNYRGWVTDSLKIKMAARDKIREEARLSKNKETWSKYKKIKNEITKETRKTKKDHFLKIYTTLQDNNDSKGIYQTTKGLLGWNRDMGPRSFLWEGNIWRKPLDLANIQSKFFEMKMERLEEQLNLQSNVRQTDPVDRLKVALGKWSESEKVKIFSFQNVSLSQTAKQIRELGNSISFGYNEIDANVLKLILPSIIAPINHITNLSLSTSSWPNKWKISRVFPLLKDKDSDKLSPAEYRPVSLLPTISKIVEREAQNQLLDFFEKSGQMNRSAHAYRKNLGTVSTLASIMDDLYRAAEDKLISEIMAVDQSAAFDCIHHPTLLRKLRLYKLDEKAIKWVENYLTGRSQYVTVGTANSEMRSITKGVPQGSVIGPLLYSIYVNEMSEIMTRDDCRNVSHLKNDKLFGESCKNCGSLSMYADDATLVISNKFRKDNQARISQLLDKMKIFLSENRLHLNVGKTKILECMLPQKRGKTPGTPPSLSVEVEPGHSKEIEDAGQLRILGINIQGNLSWWSHLESGSKALLPRVRRALGALMHIGRYMPMKTRKTLANGLILSQLHYAIPVWGLGTDNQIRRAQVILNKTARWVTGSRRRTRIKKLMEDTNWLTIKETAILQGCIFMWKLLHLDRPGHLRERVGLLDEWKIREDRPRLKFTSKCLKWKITTIWNQLEDTTRNETILPKFKKAVRCWIIECRDRDKDPDPDPD